MRLTFQLGNLDDIHQQSMEWLNKRGMNGDPFTEFLLEYGDGISDVVSSDWHLVMHSASMLELFIRLVERSEEQNTICYPVIDGVPRLCLAQIGAPIFSLLTYQEKLQYTAKNVTYAKSKVTYLANMQAYTLAASRYLESKYDID